MHYSILLWVKVIILITNLHITLVTFIAVMWGVFILCALTSGHIYWFLNSSRHKWCKVNSSKYIGFAENTPLGNEKSFLSLIGTVLFILYYYTCAVCDDVDEVLMMMIIQWCLLAAQVLLSSDTLPCSVLEVRCLLIQFVVNSPIARGGWKGQTAPGGNQGAAKLGVITAKMWW